ncbi:MAG: YceI family protein [Chloroflexota bacterium]
MTLKRISIIFLFSMGLFVLAACGGGEETAAEPTAAPAEETVAEPTAAPAEETVAEPEPTAAAVEETAVSAGGPRTFAVVSSESTASYVVQEEFLSQALSKLGIEAGNQEIVGSTTELAGELQINADNADLLEAANFTVNMGSLTTDQSRRDNWLKDNAIQSSRFPEATFVSTGVTGLSNSYSEGSEASFQLHGDLTVRDVTLPVTFDVTAVLNGDSISGVATLPINMTEFGIDPPNFADTLTVSDGFMIRIQLTAQEQ